MHFARPNVRNYNIILRAGTLESKKGEDGPSQSKNAPKREKNPSVTSTKLAPRPPQPHNSVGFNSAKPLTDLRKILLAPFRCAQDKKIEVSHKVDKRSTRPQADVYEKGHHAKGAKDK